MGKHVVMVHTIQTPDIQIELNTFYPVHFPKTKTKLEESDVDKSMSEAHTSTRHRQYTSINMYIMFVQLLFYILLTLVRYFSNTKEIMLIRDDSPISSCNDHYHERLYWRAV